MAAYLFERLCENFAKHPLTRRICLTFNFEITRSVRNELHQDDRSLHYPDARGVKFRRA